MGRATAGRLGLYPAQVPEAIGTKRPTPSDTSEHEQNNTSAATQASPGVSETGYGFETSQVALAKRIRHEQHVGRRKAGPDVFDYLDYRAFLSDTYRYKKEQGRGFSYRAFSRRAGLRSPNHLKRVIDGERPLTPEMTTRYAQALDLDEERSRYFADLVAFNNAKNASERAEAYERLTGHKGYAKAHRLDLAHAAYHSEWFIPAVREMALRPDFRADAEWIAPRLLPPITVPQAAQALRILFELELLRPTEAGGAEATDAILSTGSQTAWVHIVAYHRAMLHRASEAIDLVPAPERDLSALTFCVGEDGLRRIKARVERFRRELVALATEEEEGDRVIQVGFQVFPLTTSRAEEAR